MDAVSDEQPELAAEITTITARMRAAGINAEAITTYLAKGLVRVGGEPVTDPDHPAPWPIPVVISGS